LKNWAFAFLLILAIGGCQKQSPGTIESDYEDSLTDSVRAESCRNTELTNDLLEADNLRNLFRCTQWNEKFPAMYKSLLNMNTVSWNYFAKPINEKIFNDRVLRDQLIELVNELDGLGGLEELGKVINSLSESNFYENLFQILKCADEATICPGGNRILKEDILKFFSLFSFEESDLSNLAALTKSFSIAVAGADSFPAALRAELKKDSFNRTRLELLDQLLTKIGNSNFENDLVFYKNILSEKTSNGDYWLKEIFEKRILTEDFDYLIYYPIDVQKNMWRDFRLLNVAIESDLVCKPTGDFNGLRIDVSEHLKAFLTDLFNSSQEKFFQKTIQSIGLIKTATQMCQELSGYKGNINGYLADTANLEHQMDFVNALSSSSRLLLHNGFYELFKKFQFAHPLGGARELFMLENFSDDFFISFLRMVSTFNRGVNGPVATGHELLKNFDNSFYQSLHQLVEWAQKKDIKDFESLGRVWMSFSSEGKLFFINFLDAHYKNDADVSLLLAYYSSTFQLIKKPLSELLNQFFSRSTDAQEEEFLSSLQDVTKDLAAPELLNDFGQFFSRGHILELLKIISRGFVDQENSSRISDIYILEPSPSPLPGVQLSRGLTTATEACLSRMSEPQVSFYSLITVPPQECSIFAGEDPLMKSFFALSDFSYYLSQKGDGLTKTGILSPTLLNNYVSLFKSISERYARPNEDGLYRVLLGVHNFFKKDEARKSLQDLSEGLVVLGEEEGFLEVASAYFGSDQNFSQIPLIVEGLEVSASTYDKYRKGLLGSVLGPTTYKEQSEYNCSNYHKELGGRSCPSVSDMRTIASRLIRRATKKNEDYPTALEQMMKMISVDHGLAIPYESEETRNKVITIEESLRMFYSFTDSTIKTNSFDLEMQVYPDTVTDFFANPDWEITRDQADSELKTVNRTLNTMERVEVVVRDVRFDENYLGAHYMNAVAKAEDYNSLVDSKYGLLKKCIPLKFCGKFMNKTQHGLAKNGRDTFPSLLDANTVNNWTYGDYMQALMTSLVSSSPKISQVSSVIRKKLFGLKIDVPYLQTKKQLVDHNGKILGLVSMVSGFSNMARLVRDRVGRTDSDFDKFLNGDALKRVNKTLFRNYKPERDSKKITELVLKIEKNGFLNDFIAYFSKSDYTRQRLAENILFKGFHLISFLGEGGSRYKDLGITTFLGFADILVDHYQNISEVIDLEKTDDLVALNHFLDLAIDELSKKETPLISLLGEAALFLEVSQSRLLPILKTIISNKVKLLSLKTSFLGFKSILASLSSRAFLPDVVSFFSQLRNDQKVQLRGFQNLLRLSGARQICLPESQGESLICRKNGHQNELGRAISYLSKNSASNLLGIVDYFGRENDPDQLSFFLKIFPSLTIN